MHEDIDKKINCLTIAKKINNWGIDFSFMYTIDYIAKNIDHTGKSFITALYDQLQEISD